LAYNLGGGSWAGSNHRKRLAFPGLRPASLTLLAFCMALGSIPQAQTQSTQSEEHSSRKVLWTEEPEYPVILESKGIGGLVRLKATVLANGTVARVGILGGNPILAESAVKAVMNWKYAPAPSSTNQIVTFNFKAH
jgi:TonB family protein